VLERFTNMNNEYVDDFTDSHFIYWDVDPRKDHFLSRTVSSP